MQISNNTNAIKNIYIGIFLIALSTLMYEILLTRIFTLTMGYHFAFLAISLAMFGMTAGAIIVYILPNKFPQNKIFFILSKYSFYFSVWSVISFLLHLLVPFEYSISVKSLIIVVLTYSIISIPFIFCGICISLILTRFPNQINKLYASDLIGAALGCLLVILLLELFDCPTCIFISALFSALAALIFYNSLIIISPIKKLINGYIFILILYITVNSIFIHNNNSLVRVLWIRGDYAEKPLYEKWNSFSRISIEGDSTKYEVPFGWGLSNKYDRLRKVKQLMLNVDAHSTTVLTKFTGDTTDLLHLKYDISNAVHYLRHNADVLVLGSGGGRDFLSALLFNQKSVLGIEINKDMVRAVNKEFAGFTGNLSHYPNFTFIADEARSYLLNLDSSIKFDIIQFSVIDNLFANASGAFVFTENVLYSIDTWKLLLSKLNENGLLTVTRFYREIPIEHYKLLNISADVLNNLGIFDIRKHIILIKCQQQERLEDKSGTGTFLISKSPFNQNELNIIDSLCKVFDFELILSPTFSNDSVFTALCSKERNEFNNKFPIEISSPTDDKPFFFNFMSIIDLFNIKLWSDWDLRFNAKAIFILLALSFSMSILSVLCIVIPLKLSASKINLSDTLWYFVFFISIGLGFMLIEISQIQRLNIFLGNPTYSLSVALFTILISSGIGSFFSGTNNIKIDYFHLIRIIALLIILLLFGLLTPLIIISYQASSTLIRVIVAVLILFPVGFFLGMAFPIGLKSASLHYPSITPWLCGINGVFSVMATALAIIIAMNYGISSTYWAGTISYLIAFISLFIIIKTKN